MHFTREHQSVASGTSSAPPEPKETEIQKAAYYLWQQKGCPEGTDLETWLEARELLRHRHAHAARRTAATSFPTDSIPSRLKKRPVPGDASFN